MKLGTVSLDGTRIKANASKRKAMSWGYANKLEEQLRREVQELLNKAEQADAEDESEVVIPSLLSLCPMQITFLQDGPATSILFTRPTTVGQGSAAMPLLKVIETEVGKAVEAGISAATTREPIPGRVVQPFPGTPPVP